MKALTKYTLVQHSAWTVKRDPCFESAVELASLEYQRQIDAVNRAGGLLFDSYKEASDAEYRENYPDADEQGLIPGVRGTFATYALQGRRVYVPPVPSAPPRTAGNNPCPHCAAPVKSWDGSVLAYECGRAVKWDGTWHCLGVRGRWTDGGGECPSVKEKPRNAS
jgi:hypothetical protein